MGRPRALTDRQVQVMRELHLERHSPIEALALAFGVGYSTVRQLLASSQPDQEIIRF